jgi:hypothetical protein
MNSRHKAVADLRTKYEQVIGPVDNKSWSDYWTGMAQDGTWVDHIFIQIIAWYMELDILILTTSSKPDSPFIFISGNMNNIPAFNSRPPLILGNYTNIHYQSLLPKDGMMDSGNEQKSRLKTESQDQKTESQDQKTESQDQKTENFIFMHNNKTVTFKVLEEGKLQCPFCSQFFIRIVTHINNQNCTIYQLHIDLTEFKSQLDSFREGYTLDMSRKRKQKSRAKLREEKGPEILKAEQNKQSKKSRAKILEEKGPEVIKVEQKKQKQEYRTKLRNEKGPEVIKAGQNKHTQKSRAKILEERGPEVIKVEQNRQIQKSRAKLLEEKGPEIIKAELNIHKQKNRDKLLVTFTHKKTTE